jgi:hypothetical protein
MRSTVGQRLDCPVTIQGVCGLPFMAKAISLGLALGLFGPEFLAFDHFLYSVVVATVIQFAATVNAIISIHIGDIRADAIFVTADEHPDTITFQILGSLLQVVGAFVKCIGDGDPCIFAPLLFVFLVKGELSFKVVEGRFAIEETGFERTANVSSIFIQDPVQEATMLV